MGRFGRFVVRLFERLTREAPRRFDAAKLAKSKGMPANRFFTLEFKDEPTRVLYLGFENDKPLCTTTPRRYSARIVTSVNTILQILDQQLSFDEALAWGEISVIPMNPADFTQFDIETSRSLLKSLEKTIRDIALS